MNTGGATSDDSPILHGGIGDPAFRRISRGALGFSRSSPFSLKKGKKLQASISMERVGTDSDNTDSDNDDSAYPPVTLTRIASFAALGNETTERTERRKKMKGTAEFNRLRLLFASEAVTSLVNREVRKRSSI
jgi:hypothetical protein